MDLKLTGYFTTRSPLSHIGEAISTTSYLNQEPVLQPDGQVEEVFVYNGNAWRGQLRDLAAVYFLDAIGQPRLALDAFHLLFAGGAIGGEQSVNLDRARAWRKAIPLIALFGGGIGNQVLPGKMRVRNSYPVCREALPVLLHTDATAAEGISYRALTMEKSFTRTDNAKSPAFEPYLTLTDPTSTGMLPGMATETPKAKRDTPPEQMRMTVELLIPGVRLETGIDLLDVSEVEFGCLVSALDRFARSPYIGGQANRGHGLVDLDYALLDIETGERLVGIALSGGTVALGARAEAAKDAYDRHCRDLYDQLLAQNAGELVVMLGAA